MGVEQIILPILGGVAKGVSEGIIFNVKEKRAAQQRADDRLLDVITKDPDLLQTPEGQKALERITGDKNIAKSFAQIIGARAKFDQMAQAQGMQGIISGGQTFQDFMQQPQQEDIPNSQFPEMPTGVNPAGGILLPAVGPRSSIPSVNLPPPSFTPSRSPTAPAPQSPSALSQAFRGQASQPFTVQDLPPGVRVSKKIGGLNFSFSGQTPEVRAGMIGTMLEIMGKKPGEPVSQEELVEALRLMQQFEGGKAFEAAEGRERARQLPDLRRGRVSEAAETEVEKERARLTPDVVQGRVGEAGQTEAARQENRFRVQGSELGLGVKEALQRSTSRGSVIGEAEGGSTSLNLEGGEIRTPNQLKIEHEQKLVRAREAEKPLSPEAQKLIDAGEIVDESLRNVIRYFKSDYVGPVVGTEWAKSMRNYIPAGVTGSVGPDEGLFRANLERAKGMLLTALRGAQVSEEEMVRVDKMFPQTSYGDPDRFTAELQATYNFARGTLARSKRRLGSGKGESLQEEPLRELRLWRNPQSGTIEQVAPAGIVKRSVLTSGTKLKRDLSNLPSEITPILVQRVQELIKQGKANPKDDLFDWIEVVDELPNEK